MLILVKKIKDVSAKVKTMVALVLSYILLVGVAVYLAVKPQKALVLYSSTPRDKKGEEEIDTVTRLSRIHTYLFLTFSDDYTTYANKNEFIIPNILLWKRKDFRGYMSNFFQTVLAPDKFYSGVEIKSISVTRLTESYYEADVKALLHLGSPMIGLEKEVLYPVNLKLFYRRYFNRLFLISAKALK